MIIYLNYLRRLCMTGNMTNIMSYDLIGIKEDFKL